MVRSPTVQRRRKSGWSVIAPLLPALCASAVFIGNTNTVAKSFGLAAAILLFARRDMMLFLDRNFWTISLFMIVYGAMSHVDVQSKTEFSYSLLVMPALLYAGGRWIGHVSPKGSHAAYSYLLVGLVLASTGLSPVLTDISVYGFTGGSRSIAFGASALAVSATVLSGTLVVLASYGGVIFSGEGGLSVIKRLTLLSVFLICMITAARLGSRTLPVIGAASLSIGIFINARRASIPKLTAWIIVIAAGAYLAADYAGSHVELLSYYEDRANDEEFGAATAGGRVDRWVESLTLMLENPLGWSIQGREYAHNFWLDAARNGGWPSLLISLFMTWAFLKCLRASLRKSRGDSTFVTMTVSVGIGFLLLFMVEPILDGFEYVFAAFCCFWGMVVGFRPALRHQAVNQTGHSR